MFNSEDIHSITLNILGDPVGDGNIFYLMKAPKPITVISAYATSENAQNAGTAVTLSLQNWGTAGTAVEGTVCAALGGTASGSRLSARTPAPATVAAAQDNIDQGEWLVVAYGEEGTGWIAGDIFSYTVNYVIGQA